MKKKTQWPISSTESPAKMGPQLDKPMKIASAFERHSIDCLSLVRFRNQMLVQQNKRTEANKLPNQQLGLCGWI